MSPTVTDSSSGKHIERLAETPGLALPPSPAARLDGSRSAANAKKAAGRLAPACCPKLSPYLRRETAPVWDDQDLRRRLDAAASPTRLKPARASTFGSGITRSASIARSTVQMALLLVPQS
jgi:hypothetical protein